MKTEDYRKASDDIENQRAEAYANLDEKFIKENYGFCIGDKITIPATAFNNETGLPIAFKLNRVHILSSNKNNVMKIALRGPKLSKNGKKVLKIKCYHELTFEMDKGISCFSRLDGLLDKDHQGITLLPPKEAFEKSIVKKSPVKSVDKSISSKKKDCGALKCSGCGNYKSTYSKDDQMYWCSMFNFRFKEKDLK